jgi:hypothetical protein
LISRTIVARIVAQILHAPVTLLLSVAAHLVENNVAIPTSALLIVPGITLTSAVLPFQKGVFVQALLLRLNVEVFPAFTTVFVRPKPQVPPTAVLRSLPIRSAPVTLLLSSAAHVSMQISVLPMLLERPAAVLYLSAVLYLKALLALPTTSQSPAESINVPTAINVKPMLLERLTAAKLYLKELPALPTTILSPAELINVPTVINVKPMQPERLTAAGIQLMKDVPKTLIPLNVERTGVIT